MGVGFLEVRFFEPGGRLAQRPRELLGRRCPPWTSDVPRWEAGSPSNREGSSLRGAQALYTGSWDSATFLLNCQLLSGRDLSWFVIRLCVWPVAGA